MFVYTCTLFVVLLYSFIFGCQLNVIIYVVIYRMPWLHSSPETGVLFVFPPNIESNKYLDYCKMKNTSPVKINSVVSFKIIMVYINMYISLALYSIRRCWIICAAIWNLSCDPVMAQTLSLGYVHHLQISFVFCKLKINKIKTVSKTH